MQKKRLYTALSILLGYFIATDTYAQSPTLTLPQSNINTQLDFASTNVLSGTLPAIASGAIRLSSGAAGFVASSPSANAPILPGVLRYKVNRINNVVQLGEPTITLSSTPTTVHNITLNLGTVSLTADYTIIVQGTAWIAGTYVAALTYSNLNPSTQSLTLIVPEYITANTAPVATSTFTISSLAAFRTGGGVSATQSFDYYTTVPTVVQLKANQPNFNFATSQTYNSPAPTVASTFLTTTPTGSTAGSAGSVSTTNRTLSIANGIPVTAPNKITFNNTLSISNAELKSQFAQAGTYTLPLTYTVSTSSSYTGTAATGYTTPTSIDLIVPKLFEINVPGGTNASLIFNTAQTYSQGVTALLSSPVTLSSTVPYTVTVKASGNFISGGNSIPVSVATLEAAPAETGSVTPVVLSANDQLLISNSNPVIDRAVNLQIRIPPSQTSAFLGKPNGTYSNTITFTIVAP